MFLLKKLFKIRESALGDRFTDQEMPFLDHLEDLRRTLTKVIITLLVSTILCFAFNRHLLEIIQYPMIIAQLPPDVLQLGSLQPTETFTVPLKIAFYSAIVVAFPLLLWFAAEFIVPGLTAKERKLIAPSLTVGFGLFLIGVCFAYFVVCPTALKFFYEYGIERGINSEWRIGYYTSFITRLTIIFGVAFELPVVVMALVKLEILSHQLMKNTRNYAIVIICVVAAIITPTPDAFTLSLLAVPMILLYEICIWLALWLEKKRDRQEQLEREEQAIVSGTRLDDGDGDSESDMDKAQGSAPTIDVDANEIPDRREDDPQPAITADAEPPEYSDANAEPTHVAPTAEPKEVVDLDSKDAEKDESSVASTDSAADTDSSPDDDYQNDPYHHEYHGDDYWSGDGHHLDYHVKEELKAEICDQLRDELRRSLKQEILDEIRAELKRDREGKADAGDTEDGDTDAGAAEDGGGDEPGSYDVS